jgi:hypothetical protein
MVSPSERGGVLYPLSCERAVLYGMLALRQKIGAVPWGRRLVVVLSAATATGVRGEDVGDHRRAQRLTDRVLNRDLTHAPYPRVWTGGVPGAPVCTALAVAVAASAGAPLRRTDRATLGRQAAFESSMIGGETKPRRRTWIRAAGCGLFLRQRRKHCRMRDPRPARDQRAPPTA